MKSVEIQIAGGTNSEGAQSKPKPYTGPGYWASAVIMITCYALVIGTFYWCFEYIDEDPLWKVIWAEVIATFIVFIFSFLTNNSSMYDPYWGTVLIVILFYWNEKSLNYGSTESWVALAVVLIFAVRHVFLYARFWYGLEYEDFRFPEFKEKIGNNFLYWIFSLVGLHYLPTALTFFGLLPIYYTFNSVGIWSPALFYFGCLWSLVATIIETIADEQLYPYRIGKKTGLIDEGLWRYSRHPNYFGEVMTWWGIYFTQIGATGFSTELWFTVIGPLIMYLLFDCYSIPNMEQRTLKKRPGYAAHQRVISKFWPWFRNEKGDEVNLLKK